MKEFLNKFVYLHLALKKKDFYYTKAFITELTPEHISFLENGEPFTYRISDIVEIKLSKKATRADYALITSK